MLFRSIEKDLQNASKDLKSKETQKASSKQKSAARKMKQMSESMEMDMQGGGQEQMNEDIKMLRQIVDNLLKFSFSQEKLMNNFKVIKGNSTSFSKFIKSQQDLKYQFKHVDDSLFALSLRNPKIGEPITKEIGNIYYHIDKATDFFTDNQIPRGTSSQQYVLDSNVLSSSTSNQTGNTLLMVPQLLTTDVVFNINYDIIFIDSKGNEKYRYTNNEQNIVLRNSGNITEWLPGKKYNYTFTLGLKPIKMDATYDEWSNSAFSNPRKLDSNTPLGKRC